MYVLKKCKNVRHSVFTRVAGTFYVRHCVIYVIQYYILGIKRRLKRKGADMSKENNPNLTEVIKEIHDGVAREMYCKGIDDFAAYIREKVLFEERWLVDCKSSNANTNIAFSSIMTFINSVAEELKKVEIQ